MDDEISLLLSNAHESLGAAELLLEGGFYRDAMRYYAKALSLVESLRERADYDATFQPGEEEAMELIEDAKAFVERIEKALEELR